jgi:hypothetical protein
VTVILRPPSAPALAATIALLLAASCGPRTTPDTARRTALVSDENDVLSADSERRIRAYLDWVRESYGVDYRVVAERLDGVSPASRSSDLFARQRIGAETGGRGVLLLVDPEGRQVRAEVGYALEPYLTDVAASRMLAGYLAPHFRSGDASAGIEASIEALIDALRPHLETERIARAGAGERAADEVEDGGAASVRSENVATARRGGDAARSLSGSGGAGASLELLRALPEGVPDASTKASLRGILVPQADPRLARDLEIALLHQGIYFQEAPLYDEEWRRAARPRDWSPARLREIARQWDRPYEIAVEEQRAIAYYADAPALGPTFLRREAAGWIIDATYGARAIVYDYSNEGWYALDHDSPYLAMLQRVLPLERVELSDGRPAWQLRSAR